ncbi:unnamed protein product [Orchesella dallaii]|uniref:Uncharacterized protein n=1 Tax=Orchesella dallaii TaxID=48710 RepID=A0ABP1QWN4_9HEXA
MNLHEFGLLVIIILLLLCIIILCSICSMKVYKFLYGTFDTKDNLSMKVGGIPRSFNHSLDSRAIQTRIKYLRKPYKKMKESQAKNMPAIVEVNTPADSEYSDANKGEFEESNEKVSICPDNGGVSNFWKRETIIIL